MGLFSSKVCDFCGNSIGFLGNKKLADGDMCKECASCISPWITDRKKWTVDEMREHLDYRDSNFDYINQYFIETKRADCSSAVIAVDENNGTFIVSKYSNYKQNNADVLYLTDISQVNIDIDENITHEKLHENNAPDIEIQEYHYYFKVNIYINNSFIQNIHFTVNNTSIEPNETNEMRAAYNDTVDIINLFEGLGISVVFNDNTTFGIERLVNRILPAIVLDPRNRIHYVGHGANVHHAASVHHAPAHNAPVHQAPVHQAPSHQAPVHQAPVHQAPVHNTPVHNAPTHNMPHGSVAHNGVPHGSVSTHNAPMNNGPSGNYSRPGNNVPSGNSVRPGNNVPPSSNVRPGNTSNNGSRPSGNNGRRPMGR